MDPKKALAVFEQLVACPPERDRDVLADHITSTIDKRAGW
jgi:hypothetical protein